MQHHAREAMMIEPWEVELQKFEAVILTVCAYVRNKKYSLEQIAQLSVTLMLAHKDVTDSVCTPSEGAQDNYPVNFIDDISDAYSAAHNLLNLIRERIKESNNV
jgi:hypothetical protein